MAAIIKLFSALLVLLFILQEGHAQCDLSSIRVEQTATGSLWEGQPEYNVTVSNSCICPQSDVVVDCPGFRITKPIDPGLFAPNEDGGYLVFAGRPIFTGSPVEFTYAWENQTEITPVDSIVNCRAHH